VSETLITLLKQAIQKDGPLPLDRFMEMALYHPEQGYYESTAHQVGREGDFQTSVSIGPLLGRLLLHQFLDWQPEAAEWQWVECGAHHGQLAEDMLQAHQALPAGKWPALNYLIFEPSSKRRHIQQERLRRFGNRVHWVETWAQLAGSFQQGVLFSNELMDAMPVRRYQWSRPQKQWLEMRVGQTATGFDWVLVPGKEALRLNWISAADQKTLEGALPEGYIIEVSPAAEDWWQQAARLLKKGFLVTMDYGFKDLEKFSPSRTQGTLRTYSQHRLGDDPFEAIGQQDLTAHVDFPALERQGRQQGLKTHGWKSQEAFMHQCLESLLKTGQTLDAHECNHFKTLMHPEHFGHRFQVLIQQRGMRSDGSTPIHPRKSDHWENGQSGQNGQNG